MQTLLRTCDGNHDSFTSLVSFSENAEGPFSMAYVVVEVNGKIVFLMTDFHPDFQITLSMFNKGQLAKLLKK